MAAAASQQLPSKEANLFRQVVRYYEDKHYKKAIKAADQVLKKFPEHGETLAMKGLTVRFMPGPGRKEEAYDLVRRGLKADLKSHVCWHVYGLLYRQDREYKEAIKCYLNALRIDKENIQILRDLALLQIQMRDLPGFVETRQQLLTIKPTNRNHWISFAVAHHVNKNHDLAVQVLEEYERTIDEVPASEAYEHSEMLLYKATVLQEAGRYQEALDVLDTNKDKIKDKMGMNTMLGALLLALGRKSDAEAVYRKLLSLNPNNYRMHEGLQAAFGLEAPAAGKELSAEQVAGLTALYDELAAQYPSSSACKRIPLDFKRGEEFIAAADVYMRRYLSRGIPSLFVDVRPLYRNTAKQAVVQSLAESYVASLRSTGAFPPLHGSTAPCSPESPQTLVWSLYFLARHYDQLGRIEDALAAINEAIAHTPTVIELYTAKAKILKHAGDVEGAAQLAECARRMDLQDRYLNSTAVKALLRAGHTVAADKTAGLFTKDPDAAPTLNDMQAMWYEVAAGNSHLRQQQWGPALKKFHAVIKHFGDIAEDQFDFHSYCIRKMTLRPYLALLTMEDKLYGHEAYSKAAWGALRCYLHLHDFPPSKGSHEPDDAALAAMDPEARKAYKLAKKKEEKARKAAEERAREEKERLAKEKEAAAKEAAGKDGKKKQQAVVHREPDPDPDGAALASTTDPLGEATKLVVVLREYAAKRLATHTYAYEVYSRKGRWLLALSSVQRAVELSGASHPEVHRCVVRLCHKAQQHLPANDTVRQLLEEGLKGLLGGNSLAAYVQQWAEQHGHASLAHRLAAAEALVLLEPRSKPKALELVLGAQLSSQPHDHEECVAVHQALTSSASPSPSTSTSSTSTSSRSTTSASAASTSTSSGSVQQGLLADEAAAQRWAAMCSQAFPYSTYFKGPKCLQAVEEPVDFAHLVEAFGKLTFI